MGKQKQIFVTFDRDILILKHFAKTNNERKNFQRLS